MFFESSVSKVCEAYRGSDKMFLKEDKTYNEICKKSMSQWLCEMEQHEDVAVRCGVKLCRDYVEQLEKRIQRLEDENELKNSYLKKMVGKS